jgi:hypothetical protein
MPCIRRKELETTESPYNSTIEGASCVEVGRDPHVKTHLIGQKRIFVSSSATSASLKRPLFSRHKGMDEQSLVPMSRFCILLVSR